MIREILVPEKNSIVVELPDDYIGKEIEILAFPLNHKRTESERVAPSIDEMKAFFDSFGVDMTNFKFNRDDANDYE